MATPTTTAPTTRPSTDDQPVPTWRAAFHGDIAQGPYNDLTDPQPWTSEQVAMALNARIDRAHAVAALMACSPDDHDFDCRALGEVVEHELRAAKVLMARAAQLLETTTGGAQ